MFRPHISFIFKIKPVLIFSLVVELRKEIVNVKRSISFAKLFNFQFIFPSSPLKEREIQFGNLHNYALELRVYRVPTYFLSSNLPKLQIPISRFFFSMFSRYKSRVSILLMLESTDLE